MPFVTTPPSTETRTYQRLIHKEEEGLYLFVPVEVPEQVDKLELTYAYQRFEEVPTETGIKRTEVSIVDLGLQDETGGFRGASGSNRTAVFLSTSTSSAGYIGGEIGAGTWQVMLGAYKTSAEGCAVTITVTVTFKQQVLLKGDLHLHSTTSDGQYAVPDMIHIAKLMNLDFIFLTDHNNFYQNDYIVPDQDIVVLPGAELTHYRGHCNLLGAKRPLDSFFYNTKEELRNLLETAKTNGALVSINHPFDPDPWRWGFDLPFDLLEIQNGMFNPVTDLPSLQLWEEQLCEHRRLPIVGGSDNHGISYMQTLASPCTFLYAQSKSRTDILTALAQGNCFVSYFSTGPTIYMEMGDAGMGDIVSQAKRLTVSLDGMMPKDQIKLISNKGVRYEFVNQEDVQRSFSYEPDGSEFYRVEIWRTTLAQKCFTAEPMLAAISNPIYIGTQLWQS